ncbi:aldose 1-epimerase [Brevundimonas sp.]|uniref:aldose 1-epimerase n=1 Tax=Brevundimonas sp. TaxID=1871086 RepID=UPI002899F6C6|nr:aldose 1-epimerase [Brevundimonas sp.]
MRIERGDWTLCLRPDLGASMTSLTWRGRDVLRPAPENLDSPLAASSFPLAPYANRIDGGAFAFEGRAVRLPATPGFAPHALHGVGWRARWNVLRVHGGRVDLVLAAEAGAEWPWAWTASHRLALTEDGLEMSLSLANEDAAPMPAGLGLHPYFAVDPATRLRLSAPKVWLTDAREIPERLADAADLIDWSEAVAVAEAPFVDHAYAEWDGRAALLHDGWRVDMTASPNARWAQVYAPRGEGFVCVEPVTHRPDAHNAPAGEESGLTVLAPGGVLTLTARITASET